MPPANQNQQQNPGQATSTGQKVSNDDFLLVEPLSFRDGMVEVCRNDYCCSIPSHSRGIISVHIAFPFPVQYLIPIPIFPDVSVPIPSRCQQLLYLEYLKAEKYVYSVMHS